MKAATSMVPFDFEDSQIRVVPCEQGEPWFVATGVCTVLGIGNPSQTMTRLDADERGVISTDTPGGVQAVTTVNEPGLYALVLGYRKREARRFQRWVTHEVVRQDQRDRVGDLLLITQAIAQVRGMTPGIATAATLSCIEDHTGLASETLRRALPPPSEQEP